MAIDMRAAIEELIEKWHKLGHDIGFGIGIAHGFAGSARLDLKADLTTPRSARCLTLHLGFAMKPSLGKS